MLPTTAEVAEFRSMVSFSIEACDNAPALDWGFAPATIQTLTAEEAGAVMCGG